MKHYLSRAAGLFFVLCMVFIPFVKDDWQRIVTGFIFGKPVQFLGGLLHKKPLTLIDFSSDTRSLLLLLGLMAAIACALATLKEWHKLMLPICKTLTVYFVAFVLLKYGLDKVFLRQFYQPAPNILYSRFGNLDRDILYWSIIGTSPAYQVITGAIEVLAALFMLFKRTRFLGLLLALTALVQVVIINFAFDISVKMFSLLLLAMALYAAWQQLKALYGFLSGHKPVALPVQATIVLPVHVKAGIRCFIIGLLLLEALLPQFSATRANPLTGAYEVTEYLRNGKVQDPCNTLIKRIFIHPKNYLIFEMEDNKMGDFHFTMDEEAHVLTLTDYAGNTQKVRYERRGSTLVFDFPDGRRVITRALPWQKMPALQNQFHFFVDGI